VHQFQLRTGTKPYQPRHSRRAEHCAGRPLGWRKNYLLQLDTALLRGG
jgi:hypothetical protein